MTTGAAPGTLIAIRSPQWTVQRVPAAPTRSLRLRRWQKAALDILEQSVSGDFLAVATPGAGKTTFALAACLRHLGQHPERKVVIVAPTSHLKVQWAGAASALGLHLEPAWSSTSAFPQDMHGIVVTYQQVAAAADALRAQAPNCIVVLDEIHHAGEARAWGDSLRRAFDSAPQRIALSGTPFRSDIHPIPFVRYVNDEAVADFDYGYSAALQDRRVVRPVFFPAYGGDMEWTASDGARHAASFDDALDQVHSSQRLRTALSLDGEWLPAVLDEAHNQLMEIRCSHGDAGGLVIATDQDHAKGIAALLRHRYGVRAAVATSDDPSASDKIAAFAASTAPWLVAVRMVSEGVDIPRLRIGVYATTTTTELFFRQAVGRFVRHSGGAADAERAWMFIPDDPRLRGLAASIAEQRRHSLRRSWEDGDRSDGDQTPPGLDELVDGEDAQMNLFEVHSAHAPTSHQMVALADPSIDLRIDEDDPVDDTSLDIELPVPPTPWQDPAVAAVPGRTLAERKKYLRARNAELAKQLSVEFGADHRQVNWHLNQRSGVTRIAEATVEQLLLRAQWAEYWLGT